MTSFSNLRIRQFLHNGEVSELQHKFYDALTEDDSVDEIAKGFLEATKAADNNPTLYRYYNSRN